MKKLMLYLITIISFQSCMTTSNYYQHLNLKDATKSTLDYDDSEIKIEYDYWSEYGNFKVKIFNKSNEEIKIDFTKSFLIINDLSIPYFTGDISTQTQSFSKNYSNTYRTYNPLFYNNTGISSSITGYRDEYSISKQTLKEVIIPPNSAIELNKYNIINERIINCNLTRTPKKSQSNKVNFDLKTTPIAIRHYWTIINGKENKLESKHYVYELANYNEADYLYIVDTSICGRKLEFDEIYQDFKMRNKNSFYIKYK
jgi:hypothetical protein